MGNPRRLKLGQLLTDGSQVVVNFESRFTTREVVNAAEGGGEVLEVTHLPHFSTPLAGVSGFKC